MCGRVIQSSGPLRYAIVDGMNVRDSRVHNYPPRWNAAPSQEPLVIRRNHQTGEVSLDPLRWGLIPYCCKDPAGGRKPINAKCETVRDLPTFRDAYRKRRASRRRGKAASGHSDQVRRQASAHSRWARERGDPSRCFRNPIALSRLSVAGGAFGKSRNKPLDSLHWMLIELLPGIRKRRFRMMERFR